MKNVPYLLNLIGFEEGDGERIKIILWQKIFLNCIPPIRKTFRASLKILKNQSSQQLLYYNELLSHSALSYSVASLAETGTVLVLDGNSEIGAHVRSNLCYLICLKLPVIKRAVKNLFLLKSCVRYMF